MADESIKSLHRTLLSWDFWELSSSTEDGSGAVTDLKEVPTTFTNVQEYVSVFESLVLEECGALLLRGNDEGVLLQPHPSVVNKTTVNEAFTTLHLVLKPGANKDYTYNDMVLVSRDNPYEEKADPLYHVIGLVESHEGDSMLAVRVCLEQSCPPNIPGAHRHTARMKAVHETLHNNKNTCWWLLKLSNMATVSREWAAVHAMSKLPFQSTVLTGSVGAASVGKPKAIPGPMKEAMEAVYNESQMRAVSSGLEGASIVLIQGPPGTGKTRTILGLLGLLLHARPEGLSDLHKTAQARHLRSGLAPEERQGLWHAASPWSLMAATARDAVAPSQKEDPADAFGLLKQDKPLCLGSKTAAKARVLICAPSNAALDEVVHRLLDMGVMDPTAQVYSPSIVRVGVNVHHSVASVSLESLIQHRLEQSKDSKGSKGASKGELERIKLAILEDASIVCSTLSFSGSGIFQRLARKFDVVVIDEAAQAVEPSTLVPLTLGCSQVYLIGDPVQLPATVISSRAVTYKYDMSLFKRLQSAGYPVQVLDTQYRMHPDIAEFPSREFYSGTLKNGPRVAEDTAQPWHAHPCFGPLAVYDVHGTERAPDDSSSIVNVLEAEMVLCIYHALVVQYPALKQTAALAVISPYKAQVSLLREKFKQALGSDGAKFVDINTIDGFQGREKDIVIFSTVRSNVGKSIGFVADERRINVGITRARSSLIVIGHARALKRDVRWKNLVTHAEKRRCLYHPTKPFSEYLQSAIKGDIKLPKQAHEQFNPQSEPGADVDDYSEEEEMPNAVKMPSKKQGSKQSQTQEVAVGRTTRKRKAAAS